MLLPRSRQVRFGGGWVIGERTLNSALQAREYVSSADVGLLLASCRAGVDDDPGVRIDASLLDGVDEQRFLDLIDRHQLAGVVYRALSHLREQASCADLIDKLARRAKQNTRRALLQTAELQAIQAGLKSHGIECLFYKGPVLAAQAYGGLALRHAGDLDLLIDRDRVDVAVGVIEALGYQRTSPGFELNSAQRRVYFSHFPDYEFLHPEHGLRVELHWRLFANPRLVPSAECELAAPVESASVAGHPAGSMGWQESLLYLSAHGAKHAWFRLFWLVDIHVLLQARAIDEQIGLSERARELGVERMWLQAAMLVRRLFGTPLHPRVIDEARSERGVAQLVGVALDAIRIGEPHCVVSGATDTGTVLTKFRYFITLRADARYRWSVLIAGQVSLTDWQEIQLPERLFFLYRLLRLPLWLRRRLRSSRRGGAR